MSEKVKLPVRLINAYELLNIAGAIGPVTPAARNGKSTQSLLIDWTRASVEATPTINPEDLAEYLRRLGYEVRKNV